MVIQEEALMKSFELQAEIAGGFFVFFMELHSYLRKQLTNYGYLNLGVW